MKLSHKLNGVVLQIDCKTAVFSIIFRTRSSSVSLWWLEQEKKNKCQFLYFSPVLLFFLSLHLSFDRLRILSLRKYTDCFAAYKASKK